MKKFTLFFLAFLVSQFAISQHTCGFDHQQERLEAAHPEIRQARINLDEHLRTIDVKAMLKSHGALFKNTRYTGQIYEIPIVVHVIEPGSTSPFAGYTVTDEQIIEWVESANQMYATTHSSSFAEGTGNFDGTVIPFRLVLAKRTPECQPTNGIVRASAASLDAYNQYGVISEQSGATDGAIRGISPHWDESTYFNIYIVTTFDGNTTSAGLMGWCSYPTNPDYLYDSFIKVAAVTNESNVLAHEFGHGMGLRHPFEGASSSTTCPSNNDCTRENDLVCDTEPSRNLLSVNVYSVGQRQLQGLNPCTGEDYEGVQYNIMNYTSRAQKFTPGQRERALSVFLSTRSALTTSRGATPLDASEVVAASSCAPTGITNNRNYNMGPINVTFGDINNSSTGYNTTTRQFYVDYTTKLCLGGMSTQLMAGRSYQLSVNFEYMRQSVKTWIDFNNDGVFDDATELVASSGPLEPTAAPYVTTVTIPTTGVNSTYLRMRVRCDYTEAGNCDQLAYGQVEDYAVLVSPSVGISTYTTAEGALIYDKQADKLSLVTGTNLGTYQIFTASGALVLSGIAEANEIALNNRLNAGFYIISCKIDGVNTTQKFVIF